MYKKACRMCRVVVLLNRPIAFWTCPLPPAPSWFHKGDVTGDDSQRRFLAQHSVGMLEQCCHRSKQCRSNVAALHCAN